MDTNSYEIILTDTDKEGLEEIYNYISENLSVKKSKNFSQ